MLKCSHAGANFNRVEGVNASDRIGAAFPLARLLPAFPVLRSHSRFVATLMKRFWQMGIRLGRTEAPAMTEANRQVGRWWSVLLTVRGSNKVTFNVPDNVNGSGSGCDLWRNDPIKVSRGCHGSFKNS